MTLTNTRGVELRWLGEQVAADIRAAALEETKNAQAYAVALAKQYVPIDTGALRDSIKAERIVANQYILRGDITANTVYALYVEFGTYKMRAQPYLRPASDLAFKSYPAKLGARVRSRGTNLGLGRTAPGASVPLV